MKLTKEIIDGYKVYNVKFNSLTDLYDYLKSNPKVNSEVFKTMASKNTDTSFYGVNLDRAIEYIIGGYSKGLDNFLITSERLQQANIDVSDTRKIKRGLYGGIPLAPLVAAGVPDCMLGYERESKEVVRNVFFNLAYPSFTKSSQIINRGLAFLYIIDSLEKKGEIINFKATEVSNCGDEIVNIEIMLKKPGDLFLDIEKCYYPIVGKEFLRRILFRVLESMPVHNDWSFGYGKVLSEHQIRKLFKLKESDMVIMHPKEFGIRGNNIYNDTINAIKKLNIEDEFDIEKIKTLSKKYK